MVKYAEANGFKEETTIQIPEEEEEQVFIAESKGMVWTMFSSLHPNYNEVQNDVGLFNGNNSYI